MESYAITSPLTLPAEPPLSPEHWALFEAHGCQFERKPRSLELSVPAGTTRTEILPRMQLPRFWLRFPDGWQIWEELDWNEESLLAIPVARVREE